MGLWALHHRVWNVQVQTFISFCTPLLYSYLYVFSSLSTSSSVCEKLCMVGSTTNNCNVPQNDGKETRTTLNCRSMKKTEEAMKCIIFEVQRICYIESFLSYQYLFYFRQLLDYLHFYSQVWEIVGSVWKDIVSAGLSVII